MKRVIAVLAVLFVFYGCGGSAEEGAYYEPAPAAEAPCEAERAPAPERTVAHQEKPPSQVVEAHLRVSPEYVDVFIEPAGKKLGAYDVVLRYDPSVVQILRVESAPRGGFPGTPMVSPESFASGSTRIIGFQPGTGVSSGRTAIARIYFIPVSPGRSRITVEITNLYDPGSNRVLGVTILSSDEIVVAR